MIMHPPRKTLIAIPVLLTGGTEIQTLTLVKILKGAGYEVILTCFYAYEQDMVASMEEAGAEVILLELRREDGLWNLLRKLIMQYKKHNPAIVHVQYVAPGLVPIIAARLAGIKKVIATVHQPGRTHGWRAKFLLRLGAQLCTLFLCVSKSAEESWFGNSALFDARLFSQGRKHFTIYNAVDIELISRESTSENVDRLRTSLGLVGKKVIGYVGRLRWEKGVHTLLDAFSLVVAELPETLLLIVGDGPDRAMLEEQTQNLKLTKNIVWLGQKKQQEVFQLYGLVDVVAMPSFFEGFGLAAAEAMSAGLPVVGSNIDGLKEVVMDSHTGHIVPVGSSHAIAKALVQVLTDSCKAKGLGTNGKERVESFFSFKQYKQQVLSIYHSI